MAKPFIQTSFNSGEWAPNLWARVDIDKYRSGAALLENFFVDYRGGASTRSGTKYIIRAKTDSSAIRLIPFQASLTVGYVLQFGEGYLRFLRNGAPVLETAVVITGVTKASPGIFTAVAHGYAVGDWVYIASVVGMTQVNGKYYIIGTVPTANTFTLTDLFGTALNTTSYSTYSSGGTVQRIYTIASPYAAADLAQLKFAQNVSALILTHPDYAPYVLTFVSATSWTLTQIAFGSTVSIPGGIGTSTTLAAGNVSYAYVVTAVDVNGQESAQSAFGAVSSRTDLRTVAGTNSITWTAVAAAQSYNVYKAMPSYAGAIPAGAQFGFVGNCTGTTFNDSNITPDFSLTPPIAKNPFQGAGVQSCTVTNNGVGAGYATVPTATATAAPAGGVTAILQVSLGVTGTPGISGGGAGFTVGDSVYFANGVILIVATLGGGSSVATWQPITFAGSNPGSITSGAAPASSVSISSSGGGAAATATFVWGVRAVIPTTRGSGYLVAPTITFSSGTATATSTLEPSDAGNPAVPAFFQQRLILAGSDNAPSTLNISQPGNYYNFDLSNPIQDDDAISAPIVGAQLNNIKALIGQPGGLIVYSDDGATLVNGGAQGTPIAPSTITANPQSRVGCNDMPPIVANFDILSVQSKGSSVRDSTYNFYANVYTGTDISVISSHLFFGYQLEEWAWAEEPYKIVWATRNDGTLLSLTFLKEQEFIAWAHHTSSGGVFESVATIVEAATVGYQNFVYFVVERTINSTTVQYIEYFPERGTSSDPDDYWTVDCAIGYSGSATTTFQGAEFLSGKTVTGVADGVAITPFTMASTGNFTLGTAASQVRVGIAIQCNLQTLYIDLGNQAQTIQSKMKQLPQATLRVACTLGLTIGSSSSDLVTMKDLVVGNVGSMSNEVVTGLVTGDVRTILDPKWQEPGQLYIRQSNPFPASILGYIPQVNVPVDK